MTKKKKTYVQKEYWAIKYRVPNEGWIFHDKIFSIQGVAYMEYKLLKKCGLKVKMVLLREKDV